VKLFLTVIAGWIVLLPTAAAQVRPANRAAPPPAESARPEDRCSVQGIIVNAATGEPLRKADIIVRPVGGRGRGVAYSAVSDAAGRFSITGLNPGEYRLSAERAGFARQEFGAKRPNEPGRAIPLSAGENRTGLDIRLTPQGVVTGRVLDEDGDPIAHVLVSLMQTTYVDGRKQLMPAQNASTNDLGEYRIFGLAPGRYYLSATYRRGYVETSNAGGEEAYAPTFYPGTTSAGAAAPLEVAAGATLQGIDLRLQKMNAVQVAGRVLTPDGEPARAIAMLMPRGDGASAYMGQRVSRAFGGQGRFRFTGVTPGAYYLNAQMNGEDERLWARMQIEVGTASMEDIVLTLAPGVDLTGKVSVEGASGAAPSGARVILLSESRLRRTGAPVKPDGTFALGNVVPDAYRVTIEGLPDTAYVRSIRFGNADIAQSGLDFTRGVSPGEIAISIANTAAHIDGAVQDSAGQPAADVRVVILPEKTSDLSRPKSVMTDQNGQFSIGGLAPGEYRAYAFDDIESGAWQDPEFMKPYENDGQRINIQDNDRETIQLKLIRTRS
jgi:protocatechuate 3,4-dioxygenase beta subunit